MAIAFDGKGGISVTLYIEKIKKYDMLLSACLAIVYLYSALSPIRPFGVWQGLLLGGSAIIFFYFFRNKMIGKLTLSAVLDIKVILLLGFIIRLLWVFFSGNTWISDYHRYDALSRNILASNYLSDLDIPQGTSMITAFFYWIFGINRYAALIPVVIASVAMIYLVYDIARNIFGNITAQIAALLCCLCPEQIIYTNLITSDIYFAFFVLAAFWSLLASPSRYVTMNIFMVGAFLGMSQYVRSTSIVFLFCGALYILVYYKNRNLTHAVSSIFLLIVTYIVFLTPLVLFNYSNFKELTTNSSRVFGWSFFLSTNQVYSGKYNTEDVNLWKERVEMSRRLPQEPYKVFKYRVAKEMGMERLKEAPWRFIVNCAKKPYMFLNDPASFKWSLNGIDSGWLVFMIFAVGLLYHRALLVLSGIALFLNIRSSPDEKVRGFLFLTGCTILLVTFSHFFVEIQTRYHYMLMPYIIIVAATYFTKLTGVDVVQQITNNEVPITNSP
jgi:4-amino-4-deoxy-L-arabinose transferase-like glycosyltransferase